MQRVYKKGFKARKLQWKQFRANMTWGLINHRELINGEMGKVKSYLDFPGCQEETWKLYLKSF